MLAMLSLLLVFAFLFTESEGFCFPSVFTNRTNITSCRIEGRNLRGCSRLSPLARGYESFWMICDNSQKYNLPSEENGNTISETRLLLGEAAGNLSFKVTCDVDQGYYTFNPKCLFYELGTLYYDDLICTLTEIEEFPPEYACNAVSVGQFSLWVFIFCVMIYFI